MAAWLASLTLAVDRFKIVDIGVVLQALLSRCKREKARELNDASTVLWYEEIQATVQLANYHLQQAIRLSESVAQVGKLLSGHLDLVVESPC